MKKNNWVFPLLLFFISVGILLPVSPVYRSIPGVDPSVYLYVSRQILEGEMPYSDAWDHKQPFLYLLYAFGQWINPGSLWGVWLILVLAEFSCAWLIHRLLLPVVGRFLAFLSVTAGLLALYPVLWGGAIEEFSLPFQAAAVLLLSCILSTRNSRVRLAAGSGLGACIGLSFFLKQNLIAAGVAALVYLIGYVLITRRWREWTIFVAIAAGFCAVGILLVAYLAIGGALDSYWTAAFIFNTRYAGLGLQERFSATLDALEFISGMPGLLASFTAWIACAGIVFIQASPTFARVLRREYARWVGLGLGLGSVFLSLVVELAGGEPGFGLLQVALVGVGAGITVMSLLLFSPRQRGSLVSWLENSQAIDTPGGETITSGLNIPLFAFLYFPIILALLSLSGRNYVYYFIPFIPFLMIAFGSVAGALLDISKDPKQQLVWAVVLAAWLSIAYLPLLQLSSAYAGQRFQPLPDIIAYVDENTRPDETIMVWGKPSTYVYILSHRDAPSRYFYQVPVFEEGFNTDFNVAAEILQDMREKPPRLFLYTYELSEPVPASQCPLAAGDELNSPGSIFTYICEQYQYEGLVSEFLVFRLP